MRRFAAHSATLDDVFLALTGHPADRPTDDDELHNSTRRRPPMSIDRFRSLDVAGSSVLAGHVVASVVRNLASTLPVFGLAFLTGFRPSAGPLDWLAATGVLVLFLPYPSSAFVPIDTMPTWLHRFAENQPVTRVIEALRGLLLGLPVGSSPWKAVAWSLAIVVASVAVSGALFRRRTAA